MTALRSNIGDCPIETNIQVLQSHSPFKQQVSYTYLLESLFSNMENANFDYVPATIMALEVRESRDKKHQLKVLKIVI
ncbi:hypothetical protein P8452_69530 [Trifolium repens]|nr:hypothetical protein P8452_69530 [Trifolium repens]